MQKIDVKIQNQNEVHLQIPFESQTMHMTLDIHNPSNTLKTIAEKVHELNPNVKEVVFNTLDGAILAQNEILKNQNNIPFVMSLRRASGIVQKYAVNLNPNFSISNHNHVKQGEEAYLDYCLGIGLPKRSSFLLANFASKLHQALPKNKPMSNMEIVHGLQ